MIKSPGKPGHHIIDGIKIHTDSKMEADFIRWLVDKQGFSKKWRRKRSGAEYGVARYTPDLELSVDVNGVSKRAMVEFKPLSADEFKREARVRMCGSARHYGDVVLLLYVKKTNGWYGIDRETAELEITSPPIPGSLLMSQLSEPLRIPTINRYGRTYYSKPSMVFAKAVLGLLENVLTVISGPPTKQKRKRKR